MTKPRLSLGNNKTHQTHADCCRHQVHMCALHVPLRPHTRQNSEQTRGSCMNPCWAHASSSLWVWYKHTCEITDILYNTHTCMFNGLFSRTTSVSRHQKGTPFWILKWLYGSGISWTICKSFAPHSRQITTPVPHHSIFYGSDALPDTQPQCQSTEGSIDILYKMRLNCFWNKFANCRTDFSHALTLTPDHNWHWTQDSKHWRPLANWMTICQKGKK